MPRDNNLVLNINNAALVDEIGDLKARIAPLSEKLKELEAELKSKGEGRYRGDRYDATVSCYDQSRLDMEAVKAKLSEQFKRAHTIVSAITKLNVTARKLGI